MNGRLPADRLRELHALGWSSTRIGVELGAEANRVRAEMRALGLALVPRGHAAITITPEMCEMAQSVRGEGGRIADVARRLGVCATTVSRHAAALGINPAPMRRRA